MLRRGWEDKNRTLATGRYRLREGFCLCSENRKDLNMGKFLWEDLKPRERLKIVHKRKEN